MFNLEQYSSQELLSLVGNSFEFDLPENSHMHLRTAGLVQVVSVIFYNCMPPEIGLQFFNSDHCEYYCVTQLRFLSDISKVAWYSRLRIMGVDVMLVWAPHTNKNRDN